MGLVKHWWARFLLYGVIIAVIAWSAYHLGYRHAFGSHPVDSEADAAFVDGVIWAVGMSWIAALICAAVEGVRLLRGPSE